MKKLRLVTGIALGFVVIALGVGAFYGMRELGLVELRWFASLSWFPDWMVPVCNVTNFIISIVVGLVIGLAGIGVALETTQRARNKQSHQPVTHEQTTSKT